MPYYRPSLVSRGFHIDAATSVQMAIFLAEAEARSTLCSLLVLCKCRHLTYSNWRFLLEQQPRCRLVSVSHMHNYFRHLHARIIAYGMSLAIKTDAQIQNCFSLLSIVINIFAPCCRVIYSTKRAAQQLFADFHIAISHIQHLVMTVLGIAG